MWIVEEEEFDNRSIWKIAHETVNPLYTTGLFLYPHPRFFMFLEGIERHQWKELG